MGVRFTDTTVTIGGTPYETFDPDARLTGPCVWSPAVIRWGYDDSLDQPTPSTLNLPVTVPDGHPWPTYGDRVIVATRYQIIDEFGTVTFTSEPFVQFSGEIDGATRTRTTLTTIVEERQGTPRVEGWGITLTASGDIARLARTKLADAPWPEEPWGSARAPRIAQLVAPRIDLGVDGSGVVGETGGNYTLRARDVDAFSALEAILLGTAPEPNLLYEGHPGPRLASLYVLPVLVRETAGGPAWIERYESDPTATFWISAYNIEDDARELNVASVVNRATVRYPVPDPDRPGDYLDATHSTGDNASADLYGQSEWRLDTDALNAPDIMAPRLQRAIMARSTEQWTVPTPARIDLRRFTSPYIMRLLPSHPGQPVLLTDTPPDVDPFQRVIGGTLTLHGDPDAQAVEVTFEPARNAVTKSVPISSLVDFPLDTLTAVTIRDLADVSDAQLI